MDFFKPQVFPLNLISVVFTVAAVITYDHVRGFVGIGYVFAISITWALLSFLVEKSFLENSKTSILKYVMHAVGLTLVLVATVYILELLFGK